MPRSDHPYTPAILLKLLACAVVCAIGLAACGGSSKSPTTTAGTTSTTKTSGGGHHKGGPNNGPAPLQQIQAHVKGSVPSQTANVSPGTPVVLIVQVPKNYASKTLHIAIDRTTPTTFTATSTVVGTPLHQTSTIHESTGGAQITSVRWKCTFPIPSFCPVNVPASSPTHVQLTTARHLAAIKLSLLFDRPGAVPAPSLAPLGLPAQGSAVRATVRLAVKTPSGAKTQSASSRGTTVTAAPGSVINAVVEPESGSPAQGTLRIAVPHTSGSSITIEAGGTAGSPASTATVNSSSGSLRITGVAWGCQLPPATFCPFKSIHTTKTGLEVTLPTPRVPVALSMTTDKG
jgi:hypothetical protein